MVVLLGAGECDSVSLQQTVQAYHWVCTRHQVLVNCSLLLLAGHETTINLRCNGTLFFIRHSDQWELLQQDPAGRTKLATRSAPATILPSSPSSA